MVIAVAILPFLEGSKLCHRDRNLATQAIWLLGLNSIFSFIKTKGGVPGRLSQ